MTRLIPLQSSMLTGIAIDPSEAGELIAQFQNGDAYAYSGVPAEVALSVLFDPDSQGRAFTSKIKNGMYPYRKLSPDELDGLHV